MRGCAAPSAWPRRTRRRRLLPLPLPARPRAAPSAAAGRNRGSSARGRGRKGRGKGRSAAPLRPSQRHLNRPPSLSVGARAGVLSLLPPFWHRWDLILILVPIEAPPLPPGVCAEVTFPQEHCPPCSRPKTSPLGGLSPLFLSPGRQPGLHVSRERLWSGEESCLPSLKGTRSVSLNLLVRATPAEEGGCQQW